MGSPLQLDWAGDTIVCKDIRVNASRTGDTGTSLSTTELTALDAASSANDTTGKVAILGTSGAMTLAGALTVAGIVNSSTTATTGVTTPIGGIAAAGGFTAAPRMIHTGDEPAIATTSGSNLDIVTTETYRAEIFVPCNVSSTGVAIFNGTAVAGNVQAYLIDSTGAQVTGVLTASTAASGTTAYQRIPWVSGPFTIKGPASYWIAVQGNNSGGDLRTHTVGNFGADKQTSTTYGTLTVATAPTTFTTAVGPLASLY